MHDTVNGFFECGTCQKVCGSKTALKSHESRCCQKKKCQHCPLTFIKLNCLKKHIIRKHTDNDTHYSNKSGPVSKCDVCQREFSKKKQLNQHKVVHDKNRDMFPCSICSKTFISTRNRKLHMRATHCSNTPNHPCDLCGKQFTQKSHLNQHVKHIHLMETMPESLIHGNWTTLSHKWGR